MIQLFSSFVEWYPELIAQSDRWTAHSKWPVWMTILFTSCAHLEQKFDVASIMEKCIGTWFKQQVAPTIHPSIAVSLMLKCHFCLRATHYLVHERYWASCSCISRVHHTQKTLKWPFIFRIKGTVTRTVLFSYSVYLQSRSIQYQLFLIWHQQWIVITLMKVLPKMTGWSMYFSFSADEHLRARVKIGYTYDEYFSWSLCSVITVISKYK